MRSSRSTGYEIDFIEASASTTPDRFKGQDLMAESPISILGIPVPSRAPLFLTVIAVHVVAAIVCVIAGIRAMFTRKGSGPHLRSGRVHYWSLIAVALTSTILAIIRWTHDYHLWTMERTCLFGDTFQQSLIGSCPPLLDCR